MVPFNWSNHSPQVHLQLEPILLQLIVRHHSNLNLLHSNTRIAIVLHWCQLFAISQIFWRLAVDFSYSPKFVSHDVWERAHYFLRIRKVLEYLEEHFDEPLDLQNFASIACMERTAFSKYFRQKTGTTLRQFVRTYRISKAVGMIESSDESILQIALSVGFNNLTSFERAFKNVCGENPSHYRLQILMANHPRLSTDAIEAEH